MFFVTAMVLAGLLIQPEQAGQPLTVSAGTSEDCAANRWGVCGSVFDEVTVAEDEPVAYQSGLEPADAARATTDQGQAGAGCRRVRESYRDPVTGAVGYRFGVTCVEVSGSPPN